MAILANNSKDSVVIDRKYHYGIGDFKVLGINLSFDECQNLGFDRTKEPIYTVNTLKGEMTKIVFYCHNEKFDIKKPLDFFISDRDAVNRSGSVKIINNFGQSTSAVSIEYVKENYKWFNQEGIRIAKEGEVELIEFLVAWLNVKNYVSKEESLKGVNPDPVYIDNWEKLVNGDITELLEYFSQFKNNKLMLLVHITESKGKSYMNIYNKRFSRLSSPRLDLWNKYAQDQSKAGYPIPGEYFIGELKEYTGIKETPDNDSVYDTDLDNSL